jgi:AhpC/TSA family
VVVKLAREWSWLLLLLTTACIPARTPAGPIATLRGSDGLSHTILPNGRDQLSVLIFFSADCYCLLAHSQRIGELVQTFGPRGVRFWAIDSEVSSTIERDRAEARERAYPFPILLDPGALEARAFGAAYAGYVVVLNGRGEVLYRGGIDSDCVRLRSDSARYLKNALEDLLAGFAPRLAESKTLGCVLRTW